MKHKIKYLVLVFVASISIWANSQNTSRTFVSFNQIDNVLEIKTSDGIYKIKPYNINIVETTFIPNGEQFNPSSHAVVLKPDTKSYQLKESPNNLTFTSAGISVEIQKSPFKISYNFKSKPLISENLGYQKLDNSFFINFEIDRDEALFGGGARALGMNRRGHKLQLYNRAHYGYETKSELMNYTMPLVLSSKVYAVHFDNAPIGYLDLDSQQNNSINYESISGRTTYQIIAGDNWPELINEYTNLTGKQPMIPLWALGNFSSRFGYHSERETRETVQKFKDAKIPLDAVVVDIYWFGKDIRGHMGNFEFLKDSFPTPEKMMADFKKEGVKTVLVSEPFILTTSSKWDEASSKGYLGKDKDGNAYRYDFYFGNTGIIDIYNSEAKKWFWNIYKGLTDKGVSGWWGDLGEPEVHPSDLLHATGTADEVHNIYGHDWARLIQEGYKMDFSDTRPFILMRAGYSGSQRFGMIPWSGDVSRSWGGLQSQPEIALQMGMQGLGYMHSDLGGFGGGEVFDAELYTRWLQYGVFQPIYRPHAQEHIPAEPVFHDEKTKALAKKSIEFRYQLLPYNYTLAFENNQKGMPLMRPLFFDNNEHISITDTFLWGDSFLVSPVLYQGIEKKQVYFPKNSNWFDFYTGEKIKGGIDKEVKLNDASIPVYVKGGSFIPMIETIQTTDNYTLSNFDLHFYADEDVKESEGMLYNDDGKTPESFEKGMYEILRFKSERNSDELIISIETEKGTDFKVYNKEIKLKIHHLKDKPRKVKLNGKTVKFSWDDNSKETSIKVILKNNKSQKIKIKTT
ncbi:MAG: DUF4968 domain-containing protein [Bacteroidetes bacterium]|nr:DUF4968 domain-containing protein [Bacteroidota bacterium]